MEKKRLFVDMDGTLAVWNPTKKLEDLYEKGYFRNLEPYENVVKTIRDIVVNEPDIEVFILSAYLSDSPYALKEKEEWLKEHLPEIDKDHYCFCHCGTDKSLAVPGGIRYTDRLLDDYTVNLKDWEPPAIGIKLMNGINGTKGSWQGLRIGKDSPYIGEYIRNAMRLPLEHEPDNDIDDDIDP